MCVSVCDQDRFYFSSAVDRLDFIVYEEFFTPKVKSGDVFRSTILMSTPLFDLCFFKVESQY